MNPGSLAPVFLPSILIIPVLWYGLKPNFKQHWVNHEQFGIARLLFWFYVISGHSKRNRIHTLVRYHVWENWTATDIDWHTFPVISLTKIHLWCYSFLFFSLYHSSSSSLSAESFSSLCSSSIDGLQDLRRTSPFPSISEWYEPCGSIWSLVCMNDFWILLSRPCFSGSAGLAHTFVSLSAMLRSCKEMKRQNWTYQWSFLLKLPFLPPFLYLSY